MASEPKQLLAQIHALSAPPEYEEHDLGPSWQLGQIREALGVEDAAEAAREMREVLAAVEWSGCTLYSSGRWVESVSGRVTEDPPQYLRACPCCGGLQPEQPCLPPGGIFRIGHSPDCRLARLIGAKNV